MLNSKNRAQLKSIAHKELDNIVKINIGKDLISEEVIKSIKNCFNTHEIVKISFLKSALEKNTKNEMIFDLASATHSDIIQIIGNTALLYKPNDKLPNHIILKK